MLLSWPTHDQRAQIGNEPHSPAGARPDSSHVAEFSLGPVRLYFNSDLDSTKDPSTSNWPSMARKVKPGLGLVNQNKYLK